MGKTQIERGFYPISITDVKRYIKNCERWGYGNKDTCKYVVETTIYRIEDNYMGLFLRDGLYSDLLSIVHDMNSGSTYKRIDIPL